MSLDFGCPELTLRIPCNNLYTTCLLTVATYVYNSDGELFDQEVRNQILQIPETIRDDFYDFYRFYRQTQECFSRADYQCFEVHHNHTYRHPYPQQ
jgi:hypothetical protein